MKIFGVRIVLFPVYRVVNHTILTTIHSMLEILIFWDNFRVEVLKTTRIPHKIGSRELTVPDERKQSIDKGLCFY